MYESVCRNANLALHSTLTKPHSNCYRLAAGKRVKVSVADDFNMGEAPESFRGLDSTRVMYIAQIAQDINTLAADSNLTLRTPFALEIQVNAKP